MAREWAGRGGAVVFVGTRRGLEQRVVPGLGYRILFLPATGLKGVSMIQKLVGVMVLLVGIVKSIGLLLREKPVIVLGIGGYASAPCLIAAFFFPSIKRGIIDQNALPGLTNRLLGRIAHLIFLHFEEAVAYFNKDRVRLTGNPLARDVSKVEHTKSSRPTLLVCGGSQGAHRLNEIVVAAYPIMKQRIPALYLIHQTGESDWEWVKGQYSASDEVVVAPYFDKIDDYYVQAHLVVSRAGAGTLTELACFGLPAILVPFPFAADDHQRLNALSFVKRGAAVMEEQAGLDAQRLSDRVCELMQDQQGLAEMAKAALTLAKPHAARDIANELMAA